MKQKYQSNLLLLITAMIWGFAFVAQSVGMDYMGPLTFIGARYLIGSVALLPVLLVHTRKQKQADVDCDSQSDPESLSRRRKEKQRMLAGGGCAGIVLFTASFFQQAGIQHTTVGKAGFLTTLYIILVPILGMFFHRRVEGKVWLGAGLAMLGMYFLCLSERLSISPGDGFVLLCAICFSLHILVVDYVVERTDAVVIAFLQLLVAGILGSIAALLLEKPDLSSMFMGRIPLLYTGVMSSGVGYTLQVLGQKRADPAIASLIMSLESVFSAVGGFLILHQRLSKRELLGCALVFLAVLLVQLPFPQKKK